MTAVSFFIHTRNRVEPLKACIASILAQDFSDFDILIYDDASDQLHVETEMRKVFDDLRIEYQRGETVRNCTGARDHIMRIKKSPILIGMDDDATLFGTEALRKIMAHFDKYPDHAMVVPRIIEHQPGGDVEMVPFSRHAIAGDLTLTSRPQYVCYYLGPCYAIRQKVLEDIGYLSLKTPYGEDEVDIGYKLVRKGYKLYYRPDIVAYHDPVSVKTRRPVNLRSHIQNRVYLAWQYLPMPYAPVYLLVWLMRYTRIGLKYPSTGLADMYKHFIKAVRNRHAYIRKPLEQTAIDYLKAYHGRLWF